MFKIFRQSRKSYVKKKKTVKYLRYAVGEIVLVMIGILLALQVNNWNQNRLNSELEKKYYARLIEDLQEDKAIMQATLNYSMQVIHHANKGILFLENSPEADKNNANNLIHLYQASQIQNPASVKSTYQELLSSGNINIIQNDALKTSLIRYYEYNWTNSGVLSLSNPYRDNLRSKMPNTIQNEIRKNCDDIYIKIRDTYEVALPEKCEINVSNKEANQVIIPLKKDVSLKTDLRIILGNLRAKINFLNSLNRQLDELIVKIKSDS